MSEENDTIQQYGNIVNAIAFLTAVVAGAVIGINNVITHPNQPPINPPISESIPPKIIQPVPSQPKTNQNIIMKGIWQGAYSSGDSSSTLFITNQSDNSFEGTLNTRGNRGGVFSLAIRGSINSTTREVTMQEVAIISKPSSEKWFLGTNRGTLSSDFSSMSGTGNDPQGNSYAWNFFKQ